jgi:hypothetical protein
MSTGADPEPERDGDSLAYGNAYCHRDTYCNRNGDRDTDGYGYGYDCAFGYAIDNARSYSDSDHGTTSR